MNSDSKLDLPEKILMITKNHPSHESLLIIQNYNSELKEALQSKQEFLKELELQRSKSENELKSVEFAIESVVSKTEKMKLQLQEDIENEKYWKGQLKQTEEKKLVSVREYQKKVAEYRNQLFSCVGINEEAVMMKIDEISSELEFILKEIDLAKISFEETSMQFYTAQASYDEELIRNIQMLSHESLAENVFEKDCEILESEIKSITEQVKSMA